MKERLTKIKLCRKEILEYVLVFLSDDNPTIVPRKIDDIRSNNYLLVKQYLLPEQIKKLRQEGIIDANNILIFDRKYFTTK